MSYILDALRKADAERESGAVPDLHAQQYVTLPADDESRGNGWLLALAGGLGAALLGVLGWMWLGREAPRERVVVAAPPASVTGTTVASTLPSTSPSVAPSVAPAPVAATPAPTSPITNSMPSPPARATTSTATTPRSAKVKTPTPTSAFETTPLADGNSPTTAPRPLPNATASVKVDAVGGANRVYQAAELPDAIRRELPPVAVNGSSYAPDAGSRVLIANGQVLHEGDTVAPGLQLEKIGRRSATLSFKGYRYELMY